MLSSLKNHPFPVAAYFNYSLVLTYAFPKHQLEALIPECLTLDTFQDEWAFLAVAMVQTKSLRPKLFPPFLGNDFFLVGYRVFTRFTTQSGKRLRGLYILKSETDKKKMETLGSIFTHYKYDTIDIKHQEHQDGSIQVSSAKSKLEVSVKAHDLADLPPQSPFANWKEARRFAGPLPFTFTYFPHKKEVLIIEGIRQNWTPNPVEVQNHQIGFLDELNLENPQLANAFIIKNIPYYWKKGRIESWQP